MSLREAAIVKGGKALIESLTKGTFGSIFSQWAKDDPIAAGAGTIAAGLAGGGLLLLGGSVVGWAVGGIGAVASSLGVGYLDSFIILIILLLNIRQV